MELEEPEIWNHLRVRSAYIIKKNYILFKTKSLTFSLSLKPQAFSSSRDSRRYILRSLPAFSKMPTVHVMFRSIFLAAFGMYMSPKYSRKSSIFPIFYRAISGIELDTVAILSNNPFESVQVIFNIFGSIVDWNTATIQNRKHFPFVPCTCQFSSLAKR